MAPKKEEISELREKLNRDGFLASLTLSFDIEIENLGFNYNSSR